MSGDALVIKARGLPWSATASEVVKFFSGVNIVNGEQGIHFTYTREGKPSGECFLEVQSQDDVERALGHDNEHMGKRYIEVKEAKRTEMEWVVNRLSSNNVDNLGASDGVIRLRGLPYDCKKQDVANFFEGLQISPYGITLTLDQDGRSTGDAYVEFATQEDADQALKKHKDKIGHRYIEIFKSSKADIKYVVNGRMSDRQPLMSLRPSPYDRPAPSGGGGGGGRARGRGGMNLGPSGFNTGNFGNGYDMRSPRGGKNFPMRGGRGAMGPGGGMNNTLMPQHSKTGHSVHMRGLPFEAEVDDVVKFFAPLNPVDIRILRESNGRAKGECDVDFATHADAEAAMKKDKQNMGHRYIELFLKSTPSASGGWGNNMNRGSGNMGPGGPMNNRGGGGQMGYGGGYGGYGSNMGNNMGGPNNMGNMGGPNNMGGPHNMGGNNMGHHHMGGGHQGGGNYGGYTSFGNEPVSYPNVQGGGHY